MSNFAAMKLISVLFVLSTISFCTMPTSEKMDNANHAKYTNELIHESSPYLLQHAHNPVDWMPWSDKALEKAKKENKPLLISIGYSSCHWCHVMEKESFEDSLVADLMNKHFVCIKVDREERPDVDQVYMNAVQLMTGRGGWPLNCFATPDGRPFYGGTYFPKDNWMEILNNINRLYHDEPDKIEEYANNLVNGIRETEIIPNSTSSDDSLNLELIKSGLASWSSAFDNEYGGKNQAPKFPIPNNYQFLLNYYFHTEDENIRQHVLLTLEKMAYGGIYDQIGGGFSRYSTDDKWKVPHFEKMLYDNAQLISLYANAYRLNQNPLYKKVVDESIQFVFEELRDGNGAFYSALDADSEGEEGKYYVWKKEELESILGDDFSYAKAYFNVNSYGLWEHGNYILIRKDHNDALAKKMDISTDELEAKIETIKSKLKIERDKRIKPGLDDKSLTSWNALMVGSLVDAYYSFHNEDYLEEAIKSAKFIVNQQMNDDGSLWHSYKNGKSSINGFLEDYCFSAEAFIKLYEATLDHDWLEKAVILTDYSLINFFDKESKLFYFTSNKDADLISRSKEINDNVIPASNSSMARVLFRLGKLYPDLEYETISKNMLLQIKGQLNTYLPSYSNWAILLMEQTNPFYELAITGEDAKEKLLEIHETFIPNKIILGMTEEQVSLDLLKDKWIDGETMIYVCENKVCLRPVNKANEAVNLMLP